jgi:NMD protein affecting ribosome stability and mRNA decay
MYSLTNKGCGGRSCPHCGKYFRTSHIMDTTYCPYCFQPAPDLAFITEEQKKYLTAFYDAFARAHLQQKSTSLEMAEITDTISTWHYSEEKQQRHFTCRTEKCGAQTDILGEYGYCPRCGRTNARKLFSRLLRPRTRAPRRSPEDGRRSPRARPGVGEDDGGRSFAP